MKIENFVEKRLAAMEARSRMYAGTTESFILQLMLLVEVALVSKNQAFDSRHDLMAELCGKESGCAVPNKPLEDEWARTRVAIARKYLP